MTQAQSGDTVRIHYTCSTIDGEVYDTSSGRDPLEFTIGSGKIIPGLDAALAGMAVGDKKVVTVPVDQAYGPVDPARRQSVPRADIAADIPLEVGGFLQVRSPEGQVMPLTVVEVTEETVTVDANHPLAGHDLTFAIELVSIG